jgi:hypothetical protein
MSEKKPLKKTYDDLPQPQKPVKMPNVKPPKPSEKK